MERAYTRDYTRICSAVEIFFPNPNRIKANEKYS